MSFRLFLKKLKICLLGYPIKKKNKGKKLKEKENRKKN